MKYTALSLPLLLLAIAACGPAELIVTAEVEIMDPETGTPVSRPVDDLDIQLLPFDRDQIFETLIAEAPPEPQMPAELQVARDSIAAAAQEWQEFQSREQALREQLQQLSEELEQYNPAEAQYRVLFNEFNDLEAEYEAVGSTRAAAFDLRSRLENENFSSIQEYCAILVGWEEQAFGPYGEAVATQLQLSGREIFADTTDATGRGNFAADPGTWWIYARYPLATEELYWNEPINLERGDPIEVPLTRSNAEVRDIVCTGG